MATNEAKLFPRFESTYEELKLMNNKDYEIPVLRFESTYEELKLHPRTLHSLL